MFIIYNSKLHKRRITIVATYPAQRGSRMAALVRVEYMDSSNS